MSNAPRTPDDGRNERQRQQQEQDTRKKQAHQREPDDKARRELLEQKPFDFIERTKPEDRLNVGGGQLTRDNVNPAIPSAEPGTGDIVDPKSLGMETSGGVAPPVAPTQREGELPPGHGNNSLNEPPGSDVGGGEGGAGPAPDEPLVLSDISPDTLVVGSGTFMLTVTGSGFDATCIVVFDDADMPTTFVSATELTADCPASGVAGIVDVEVHRGEDLSEVLQFEFTAVALMSTEKKKQAPKPPKGKKGKR